MQFYQYVWKINERLYNEITPFNLSRSWTVNFFFLSVTALHIFRMSYKGKNPGRSNLIFHAIDWMKVSYWLHVCICHLREKIPVKFHFDVDLNMNLSRLLLAIETRKSSFELVREGILETSWIICICPDSFCGRSVSLIEEEIKIEWDFIFWTLITKLSDPSKTQFLFICFCMNRTFHVLIFDDLF